MEPSSEMGADILLFGSQGSSSHFDVNLLAEVDRKSPEASQTARDFLLSCFEAFERDLESLTDDERVTIGPWTCEQLNRPEALLSPPATSRSSPVVESLNLYLHQVIDLIIYGFYGTRRSRTETIGLCSGMLPAVLAAVFPSTTTLDEFLGYAVDGFRTTFWIGLRNSLFTDRHSKTKIQGPWALTVRGLSIQQAQEKIEEHNRKSVSHTYALEGTLLVVSHISQKPELPLRISAIVDDNLLSVAGEASDIHAFKETLPPDIAARYPHIHGYFHGNDILEPVLSEVLLDIERHGIRFPTWEMLKTRIRSAATGELLEPCDTPLVRIVLEHIFIQQVDWKTTWNAVLQHYAPEVAGHDTRVVMIGPNTSSLRLTSRLERTISVPDCVTTTSLAALDGCADDIAIVGMSVDFPSGSGKEEFWETMRDGVSTVREIPDSRFDNSVYYDSDQGKQKPGRKTKIKYGNFLDNPFAFDNALFDISPREANSMDPQQRLLLHASLDALEDAGYQPDATATFQRDSFGVFVGVATGDYVDNLRDQPDVYYSTGTLRAFLAGRISYVFGFKGPSLVVDTACSSSLVAIHQACRALRSGDCTAALAGGVNVISSPDMYLGLARAHFLSETGQCKPFDEGADGYCRAEGCGVVVLKRLSRAVEEGDRILGVIRGVEVNQCGDAKSITHPDSDTQSTLFHTLLSNTNVSSDMISVVEAHGTGTQAGDGAENRSLQSVFKSPRQPDSPMYLGSVKGNIGHAEAASGMAGLAKLLLMLEHRQIPPQASFTKLNANLDLITSGKATVPTQLLPWETPRGRRRLAMLNNFGAAGSNAVLLLQEAPESPWRYQDDKAPRSCHVLNISAKTESALESLRSQYASLMSSSSQGMDLASFCYSANARKMEHEAFRLSAIGKNEKDLLANLLREPVVSRSMHLRRKVVFVFSGQGGIYSGMGAELLQTCPEFGTTVRTCDKILQSKGFPATWKYLAGEIGSQPGDVDTHSLIVLQQCACFVLQYALARMWIGMGVMADMVAGHSLGEYAALTVAGVIKLSDAMRLVAKRADLMARLCEHDATGMLACRLSPASVQELISTSSGLSRLSISCENGPQDTVISGPRHELSAFVEMARSMGAKATPVDVPFAYHSETMDPLMETFIAELKSISLAAHRIPVGSGLRGRVLATHEHIDSIYLAEHCRQPVKFTQLTEDISQACSTPDTEVELLEIGPSQITISKMKWAFTSTPFSLVPSLKPTETPWATISASLRALYLQGHRINWREVYAGSGARFTYNSVRYPLRKSTFVVPYVERPSGATTTSSDDASELPDIKLPFDFLDKVLEDEGEKTVFQTQIAAITPFIESHIVGGVPLCPASIFIEVAMQAAEIVDTSPSSAFRTISDVNFNSPLVSSKSASAEISLLAETRKGPTPGQISFECASSQGTHCTGTMAITPPTIMDSLRHRKAAYVRRQILGVFSSESSCPPERFSSNTIYSVIFPRVVSYSGSLVTLKSLQVSPSGLEGHGLFHMPARAPNEKMVSHPALVDTLLHAAGFIANSTADANTAYICSHIENIIVPTDGLPPPSEQLQVYCSLVDIDHSIVADAYALNGAGDVIAWTEGCFFKKLALGSFKAHLTKLLDKPKHHPSMKNGVRPTPHVREQPPAGPPPAAQWAIDGTRQVPSSGLLKTIREICGLGNDEPLSPSTALSSLGIDSLLLIELGDLLSQSLDSLDAMLDFSGCETVGDLERVVAEAGGVATDESCAPELLNESNSDTSLVDTPATTPARVKAQLNDSAFKAVVEVFQNVFGLDVSGLHKSTVIGSLGVDSLGSMELADVLQERLGPDSLEQLGALPQLTLEEMERLFFSTTVSRSMAPPSISPNIRNTSSPTPNGGNNGHHSSRTRGSWDKNQTFPQAIGVHKPNRTPLYLFHDGSGKCSMYEQLDIPGYNVFGVYSLDFDQLNPDIQTMEELASLYINRAGLLSVGELSLGGWSFGGVLAFEIARQLQLAGRVVRHLVLIDSPFPVGHEPLPQAVISHIVGGGDGARRRSSSTTTTTRVRDALAAQFTRNAQMLERYDPTPPPPPPRGGGMACTMINCTKIFDTEGLCGVRYPWLCSLGARREALRAWSEFLGGAMRVLDLESDHFQVFHATNLDNVSALIRKALDD